MRHIITAFTLVFILACQQGSSTQEKTTTPGENGVLHEEVLHIGKMHCEMCILSVEKGLKSVEGVEFVKVNLEDSTAIVRYDNSKASLDDFQKAVEKRGYVLKDN